MSKYMNISQIREEIDYIKTEVKYADIYQQGDVIDDNFILVQNALSHIVTSSHACTVGQRGSVSAT